MRRCVLLVMLAMAAADTTGAAEPLKPFRATYDVVWHSMTAGTNQMDLALDSDHHYVYTSRANARGLFRVVFSEEIRQTSWFTVNDAGVQPSRYRGDDGTDDKERDIALDFDWTAGRVTGVAEQKPVDLALVPNAQDVMSIQMAHIYDLLRGARIGSYSIVDKTRIKEYTYVPEGTARIKTAIGDLDTVVWRAERGTGSRRVTRTWHAPSLDYLPVRAERLNDGKREWLMVITTLKR
jgi:hypothetical protein